MASTSGNLVALTGSTGFLGKYIAAEVLNSGRKVRCLIRDRAKARQYLPSNPNLSLVQGDCLDATVLSELVAGASACVHAIGILREAPGGQTFRKLHIEATRAIVTACEKSGVRRLIHISALGVSDTGVTDYQRSKWEAEKIVRASGLDYTILRPGLIHGPGSGFMDMAVGWVSGLEQPWIFIPYFTRGVEDKRIPLGGDTQVDPLVAPIYVADVAKAVALALDSNASIGETYNLVGPEILSFPELLIKIRDGVPGSNHTLRPFGIPAKLSSAIAAAAMKVGMGQFLPHDDGMPLMAAEDSIADQHKMLNHLGLNPQGFTKSFRSYADSL